MVKLSGPCMSMGSGAPIRKQRRVWPSYTPPPPQPNYKCDSSTGSQNWVGTYTLAGSNDGKPYFLLVKSGNRYLYWVQAEGRWVASLQLGYSGMGVYIGPANSPVGLYQEDTVGNQLVFSEA